MRPITEIIIHCSATKPEWMQNNSSAQKRDEITRWHVEGNGWRDIGYHALIDRNGSVMVGRGVNVIGAHCKGHNTGTLGVCLIGGHGSSSTDKFTDNYTPEQDMALRKYIKSTRMQYPAINKVSGHNEYAAKACPGFSVREWIKDLPLVADAPIIHAEPAEQPQGVWAAIIAAILAIFGGKK